MVIGHFASALCGTVIPIKTTPVVSIDCYMAFTYLSRIFFVKYRRREIFRRYLTWNQSKFSI